MTVPQEVIKALRDVVLNTGGIGRLLIEQFPALWDSLSGAYVTDLTLEGIIALGRLAGEIPREYPERCHQQPVTSI